MDNRPQRTKHSIKDPEILDLVKNIFIIIDQPWDDVAAYDLAERIDAFLEKKQLDSCSSYSSDVKAAIRADRKKLLEKLSRETMYGYDDIFEDVDID